ncbi:hypothetical protein LCGC14_1080060 [marine sediment metagenome]|uniref:Uncharacterized protein n=1 Tax=marine sediment metagenome TaxID=412755 RepID=A0A0F9QLC5_9ZZZZ
MIELTPPIRGISKGLPVDKEPITTSGYMNNVRPIDTLERRLRLGQRPGLDKWGAGVQIGAAEQPVVALTVVASVL